MGQIVLLDDLTINKIAAGEVVDRPASIVKELVENSIDAGADNITIEIKNGGISYIRITDNGSGIRQDDVELAFERHATSKIRKEEDIHTVKSMGFRGEALASVCAISNVEVVTKHKEENIGSRIVVEGGDILEFTEAASPVGTTIKVRNVFFNVPARYKFLKKDYTEAGYIEDAVKRIALVNPDIAIKFINNGKVLMSTIGNGDIKTCVYSIFGKNYANSIIKVNAEMNGVRVDGVVGTQAISRATRSQEFFYVNKRYIKDKTLSSAVENGFIQNIAIGKYPFCVLNITVNPSLVDVNVHPAKLEVKFENEGQIFTAVSTAVRNAIYKHNVENSPFTVTTAEERIENNLEQSSHIETFSNIESTLSAQNIQGPSLATVNPVAGTSMNTIMNTNNEKDSKVDSNNNAEIPSYAKEVAETKDSYISIDNNEETPALDYAAKEILLSKIKRSEEERPKYENVSFFNKIKEDFTSDPVENVENGEENTAPSEQVKEDVIYKYRGTIFKTYPIVEIGDKAYIVDQHAAHERLLYEKVKTIYYSKDKSTQMLLLPILVELSNKEMSIFLNNKKVFEDMGFIVSEFGDSAVKIEGVPNLSFDIDNKSMFLDLLDELMGAETSNRIEKENRFLATVACKAAVKGNSYLKEEEYKKLIDDMMKLDKPFTCPHGRPTAYEISKYEIERRFLRK